MNYRKLFWGVICLGWWWSATAQPGGQAMSVDDLADWQRITQRAISDDGRWVAYKMESWRGDGSVYLHAADGTSRAMFAPAKGFAFSASDRYWVVTVTPSRTLLDSLRLQKVKDDQLPMDRLVICQVEGARETIDSLRGFRLAESADWLAYQRGRNDSTLYVRTLDGTKSYRFEGVTDYQFAKRSPKLYFVSKGGTLQAGLYGVDPEQGEPVQLKAGDGVFAQTTFDESGDRLAFLYSESKDSTYKAMSLWLSQKGAPARMIAQRGDRAFPKGWVISEYGKLNFSKSGGRLFFGTAPEPRQKDTTVLAANRPEVQVWSWDEPVQYTVQQYNLKQDFQKSYRALYDLAQNKLMQLADQTLPDLILDADSEAPVALLAGSERYSLSSMWEGRTRNDYYTVSLQTGERHLLSEGDYSDYRLSPSGKYAYTYAQTDSCWYTISLADGERHQLTTPDRFVAWDEENDQPDYPGAYGAAGWTDDDRYLLIYDRYDLWRFDPMGASEPLRLTTNGRENQLQYRLRSLDPEARTIDLSKPYLMVGFDERTKGYGYYEARLDRPGIPETLMAGPYLLSTPLKAKKADRVIFTIETFERFPDLQTTDLTFQHPVQISHGDRQQEPFLWGTAELVSWISLDGQRLEGVVYKPANFDPSKKYPLLVNFYERNANSLYNFRMPEAHRSSIDYHFYNSHEYIVFNPDIRYRVGYPGESCFNCVMPGITMLLAQGYIDEKSIGAQGHSWGGYQVAYLATRTDLFAAIESGAPVVNMFSAYGGIRWGSGLARAFQYEHTQSRQGGTPWTTPMRYFENSPLFTMDKVNTPILIMHNDSDGHVPWYQGIEYFVAMKRLGKPCWLLNYTGEPHWPTRMANKIDFQTRMFQFFEHFLKHRPAPKWLEEGVPAVDQPYELGY